MEKPDSGPPDLSALINSAESEVEKQNRVLQRGVKARRSPALSAILLGGLVVILAYCGHWLWVALRPPPQQQVVHDLEMAVDQARTSVEAAKSSTGDLPEALPNASLAAVVRYEPDKDDYKLVATMMGVRVTLQRNGAKTTDVGVPE